MAEDFNRARLFACRPVADSGRADGGTGCAFRARSISALRGIDRRQDVTADLAPLLHREDVQPYSGSERRRDCRAGPARPAAQSRRALRGDVRITSCELPLIFPKGWSLSSGVMRAQPSMRWLRAYSLPQLLTSSDARASPPVPAAPAADRI